MSAPRIDLKDLAIRESEQVEWKENVADVADVVATRNPPPLFEATEVRVVCTLPAHPRALGG